MSRDGGDLETGLATGLVGLGILLILLLGFWWLKGLSTVVQALGCDADHRFLWGSLAAAALLIILAVVTQGNEIFIYLAIASCVVVYAIAQRIVSSSSERAGSARSLDDVIRMRW